MLGAVPAPAAAPRIARSLESLMDNLGESFTTRLLRLIDERGLKDSTVYKQSNISRQHFSKIQCNRDYNPKKKTVLAFAVGPHLSEDETIDLLKSAGYAFSDGSKRDWIVRYCLEHKIYNINQVNPNTIRNSWVRDLSIVDLLPSVCGILLPTKAIHHKTGL